MFIISVILFALRASSQGLEPVATNFVSRNSLPAFSLRLGNDTASVCNTTKPGIAGFLDSEDDRHVFFWVYESRHDFSTDPVILWMSGGPGASSVGFGGLMELGPCRIAPEGGYTVENLFGWNANATVLFVDQPAGVGFSHAKVAPNGLIESTAMLYQFLQQFFVAFPQLSEREFYIAGESYGGSWVPALGAHIKKTQLASEGVLQPAGSRGREQQPLGVSQALRHINLKGIMIGNGLVRESVQNIGHFEAACSGPSSLFSDSMCKKWAPRALWCEQNFGICETAGALSPECQDARTKCTEMTQVVPEQLHLNPYDWRMKCTDPLSCYKEQSTIPEYMNSTSVKKALGVPGDAAFIPISFEVYERWDALGDVWRASDRYVNYLLDADIRVLIYVGNKDWYCSAAGMRRLVDEGLSWNGHPFFRFRPLNSWYAGAKEAGRGKSYGVLSYAEVADAGHLSPYDKPFEVLTLINSWIQGSLPY